MAAEGQAVVPDQIGGLLRCANLRQVARRGADQPAAGANAARNQTGVPLPSDPNRQIETFLHQIDEPVGHDQAHLHRRVALLKIRDRRHQMQASEAAWNGESQNATGRPARLCHRQLGLFQVDQNFARARVKDLPGFGQAQPARGAMKQPRAQLVLQVRDLPRHRRRRQAEPATRRRKTAGLDHLRENPHRRKTHHGVTNLCINRKSTVLFFLLIT